MNKRTILGLLVLVMMQMAVGQQTKSTLILLKTNMGDMKIKLYDETPKHRDNFIKLVTAKYFDSLLFHRVIKDFMIQAGDPNSRHAAKGKQLGSGGPGYTVPAEIVTGLIHKKGVLSAARQGDEVNPAKASSGSQFYIVQGKTYTDQALDQIESKINMGTRNAWMREFVMLPENKKYKDEIGKYRQARNSAKLDSISRVVAALAEERHKNYIPFAYTPEQRTLYKTVGGTPFLDTNYTIFGEVVEGLDIVDKIAAVKTLPGDRPDEDVVILSATIIKN